MGVYVGDTSLADCKVGDIQVNSIYVGDKLIWPTAKFRWTKIWVPDISLPHYTQSGGYKGISNWAYTLYNTISSKEGKYGVIYVIDGEFFRQNSKPLSSNTDTYAFNYYLTGQNTATGVSKVNGEMRFLSAIGNIYMNIYPNTEDSTELENFYSSISLNQVKAVNCNYIFPLATNELTGGNLSTFIIPSSMLTSNIMVFFQYFSNNSDSTLHTYTGGMYEEWIDASAYPNSYVVQESEFQTQRWW